MPTPLWKKGQSGNPKGKPKGAKSFSTVFDETVKEIAKANKISKQEVWAILFKKAYSEAKDGKFDFYRDIMDRYYGKAKDNLDITSKGEKIEKINYIIPDDTNHKTDT